MLPGGRLISNMFGPDLEMVSLAPKGFSFAWTALVSGLGLLPLALGAGEPGREIEGPMAVVILGGLSTPIALNPLALPTLALRFGRFVRDVQTGRNTGAAAIRNREQGLPQPKRWS